MQRSEQINELAAALAIAQGNFPAIHKGRTASVKTKAGGSYSYDYADLEDVLTMVRPVLSVNGLSITHDQKTTRDPLGVETTAILLHSSGQWKSGESIWLPCSDAMQPTQAIGSAMTYGRRYTVQSILGISTDSDDDGNAASGNEATTAPKAKPAPAKSEPKPAKPTKHVSDSLASELKEIGCKSPTEAESVIRYATEGRFSLSDCQGNDETSESVRLLIETWLLAEMVSGIDRPAALAQLFTVATSAVDK